MGHNTGISESYYRPNEKEVLEDYLRAAESLTINQEKNVLQKQLEKIKRDNEFIIRGKLQEKDEEIQTMKEDLNYMRSQMNDVLEALKIAKKTNGMVGEIQMLDEKRRMTFGYVNSNNKFTEVKIPLDEVEIKDVVKMTGPCRIRPS